MLEHDLAERPPFAFAANANRPALFQIMIEQGDARAVSPDPRARRRRRHSGDRGNHPDIPSSDLAGALRANRESPLRHWIDQDVDGLRHLREDALRVRARA